MPSGLGEEVGTWLRVVARHLDDPSGVELLADVEGLVSSGRSAEALGVVGAAQALGDVLGEPLVSSARRAQWRIDRGHRQALDARTVAHYLPHPRVEEALRDLVGGAGATWALHLLGAGGVGKTMAVRDLSSGRFAARWGLAQPPVARIDFDHLDPRYPYGRPGELLLALVGELFTYSSTREAESAFRDTDDALALLHEAVAAPDGVDPGLLDDAVRTFADLLDSLGGVVVLVLDTCEELAKLHPPGGRAPAVDKTFELLERLHARAPSMRVVLAGRRTLVPSPDGRTSGGLVLDPARRRPARRPGGRPRRPPHGSASAAAPRALWRRQSRVRRSGRAHTCQTAHRAGQTGRRSRRSGRRVGSPVRSAAQDRNHAGGPARPSPAGLGTARPAA